MSQLLPPLVSIDCRWPARVPPREVVDRVKLLNYFGLTGPPGRVTGRGLRAGTYFYISGAFECLVGYSRRARSNSFAVAEEVPPDASDVAHVNRAELER
jgi:hypothetical protein